MEGHVSLPFQARLNLSSTFYRVRKKSDIESCLLVWLNFTLGIGYMIGSGFKEEWCTFSRNHFAGSSAQMVSAELGLTSTQQTSYPRIIATGFTTLVMTKKFGSTMAILIYMFWDKLDGNTPRDTYITHSRVRVSLCVQRFCAFHPTCDISPIATGLPTNLIQKEVFVTINLNLATKYIRHISKADELDDDQSGPSVFS